MHPADQLFVTAGREQITAVGTELADADLKAIAGLAAGIRIPKVESAEEVQWVRDRARNLPLTCASRPLAGSWPRTKCGAVGREGPRKWSRLAPALGDMAM